MNKLGTASDRFLGPAISRRWLAAGGIEDVEHDKKSQCGGAEGDGDDAEPHQDQGAIVLPGRIADTDHEMQSAKELGEEPDHGGDGDSRPTRIDEAMEHKGAKGREAGPWGGDLGRGLVDVAMEHGRDLPHFLRQRHKFLRQDGLDSVRQGLFGIVVHLDQ
jgi:hypothetical protein